MSTYVLLCTFHEEGQLHGLGHFLFPISSFYLIKILNLIIRICDGRMNRNTDGENRGVTARGRGATSSIPRKSPKKKKEMDLFECTLDALQRRWWERVWR